MTSDIDTAAEEASTRLLRSVVSGTSEAIPRSVAIDEYVRRGTRNAAEFLAEVANRDDEDLSVRFQVTLGVAMTRDRNRSELLTGLLKSPEPVVRSAALRGLAHVGDESALDAITRIEARPADAALAREASFAATMISHRAGLDRHAFTPPPASRLLEPDATTGVPIDISTARRPAVREVLERARQGLIGFDPSEDLPAHNIDCVGRKMLVVPDRAIERGPDRLFEAPAIVAGMFTGAELSLGEYELSNYILSRPGARGGSLQFSVWSNRGRMWVAGTAELADGEYLTFEARGVETKNAVPTLVSGRYLGRSGKWEIDAAVSSPQIRRERRNVGRPAPAPRE